MSTQQAYEQRVRAIAEESIQSFIYECQKEDNTFALIGADKENLLQLFLPAARIAVKHMADEVKDALFSVDASSATVITYLVDAGLIPDQEAGKHE